MTGDISSSRPDSSITVGSAVAIDAGRASRCSGAVGHLAVIGMHSGIIGASETMARLGVKAHGSPLAPSTKQGKPGHGDDRAPDGSDEVGHGSAAQKAVLFVRR